VEQRSIIFLLRLGLTLASFLIYFGAYSQEFRPIKGFDCNGDSAFVADLAAGVIKVYEPGARGWSDTYQRLLLEHCKIEWIINNRFGLEEAEYCYNASSIPYIQKSFGDTIFDYYRILANKMDREGLGDRYPQFKPKQDSLIQRFFEENIKPEFYAQYLEERAEFSFYAYLSLDSSGKVMAVQPSGVLEKPLDTALKEWSLKIPYHLQAALDNGIPAEGSISIRLRFNARSKEIFNQAH
jgi:hypothetical protein